MKTITVSGKTYDEAITNALIELQTTSEHLKVKVIEKGSNGLFGVIGGKPCIIEASIKEEDEEIDNLKDIKESTVKEDNLKEVVNDVPLTEKEVKENIQEKNDINVDNETQINSEDTKISSEKIEKTSDTKYDNKRDDRKIISSDEINELLNKANDFLEEIFKTMEMDVKISKDFDSDNNELAINLEGEDMGILIGKRGQTLDSIQYLVSLVVNKHIDGYVRVKVDTENYRERRKDKLEILAKNIARKVKRTKSSVTLEPMNPYERRIIHSALQNDPYVTTKSEGEDPYRHIVVVLKNGYYKSNQRRNNRYNGNRNYRNRNKEENTSEQ